MVERRGIEPRTFALPVRSVGESFHGVACSRGQLAATSERGELLRGLREARLRYLLALVSSDPEERAKRDRYGAELAEWTERVEAALVVSEANQA